MAFNAYPTTLTTIKLKILRFLSKFFLHVIIKPNQLGLEISQASDKISFFSSFLQRSGAFPIVHSLSLPKYLLPLNYNLNVNIYLWWNSNIYKYKYNASLDNRCYNSGKPAATVMTSSPRMILQFSSNDDIRES